MICGSALAAEANVITARCSGSGGGSFHGTELGCSEVLAESRHGGWPPWGVGSDHPLPVAHDGAPGQILVLTPYLDSFGTEDQIDAVAGVSPGIPTRLRGIRLSQHPRGLSRRDGLDQNGVDHDHFPGLAQGEADPWVSRDVGDRP